jgi:hypothetical protein
MANKLDKDQTATLEEVIISQSYEIAALVNLLERKGILTKTEVLEEIISLRNVK